MEKYLKELGLHLLRVSLIMVDFSIYLNLEEKKVKYAFEAGIFHDLGKLRVSKNIINKPSNLNDEEMREMKKHVRYGEEYSSGLDREAWLAISEHHEDFGGTGYPMGLKNYEISYMGRMLRIVDTYDAIRTERAYKDAYPFEKTIEIMKYEMIEKNKFDNEIFYKFIDFIKSKGVDYYYIIGNVQLQTKNLLYRRENLEEKLG